MKDTRTGARRMKVKMKTMAWLGVLAALAGCGPGVGALTVTAWGEEYIEQLVPAAQGDGPGFVDGWEVRFERFAVTLRDFSLATHEGDAGPTQATPFIVDLVKPGPVTLFSWADVPAEKWDDVSYVIAPPGADATGAGAIAAADVERMKSKGEALSIAGVATRGNVTRRFDWSFSGDTLYADCHNDDFGEGVTVRSGAEEVVQLTIHGDHLFYDDLEAPDSVMRFEALAQADADEDGVITLDELAAVQLTSLPLGQYGTGSAGSVHTLKDFVSALSRTVGHFRGEGECVSRAR